MTNEEILTGLNNALSRGQSLQSAMQSLINAGYNSQEVIEASHYAGTGVTGAISSISPISQRPIQQSPLRAPQFQQQISKEQPQITRQKRKVSIGVIILIIALLVLLAALGIFIWKGEAILKAVFG